MLWLLKFKLLLGIYNVYNFIIFGYPKYRYMAANFKLFCLLFVLIAAATSCKKEETTIVEYEPINIAGKWHVTSWYDSQVEAIENYPAILDSTIITFSDTGRVVIRSSCAGAGAYFLQTQTQEILVNSLTYSGLFCGTLENETQDIIFDAFELAYSFTLVDDKLTIRSSKAATPYLYLRKL
jgi:hypothetical protein